MGYIWTLTSHIFRSCFHICGFSFLSFPCLLLAPLFSFYAIPCSYYLVSISVSSVDDVQALLLRAIRRLYTSILSVHDAAVLCAYMHYPFLLPGEAGLLADFC